MAEEINRIVTFFAGESLCGIDIMETQEIIKTTQMTPVPLAPDTISGIINLRGSIVTVIDLNRRLGLSEESGFIDPVSHRIIIVRIQEESIGLLVNAIGDVIDIAPGDLAPPRQYPGDSRPVLQVGAAA